MELQQIKNFFIKMPNSYFKLVEKLTTQQNTMFKIAYVS